MKTVFRYSFQFLLVLAYAGTICAQAVCTPPKILVTCTHSNPYPEAPTTYLVDGSLTGSAACNPGDSEASVSGSAAAEPGVVSAGGSISARGGRGTVLAGCTYYDSISLPFDGTAHFTVQIRQLNFDDSTGGTVSGAFSLNGSPVPIPLGCGTFTETPSCGTPNIISGIGTAIFDVAFQNGIAIPFTATASVQISDACCGSTSIRTMVTYDVTITRDENALLLAFFN